MKIQKMTNESDGVGHLRQLCLDRKLYVWGAGNQGRGIAQILCNRNFELQGFVDSSVQMQRRSALNLPIVSPAEILAAPVGEYFLIISSFFHEDEIIQACQTAGMKDGVDFVSYKILKPLDFAIEVSGCCNLRCLSCPRAQHSEAARPAQMMSLSDFRLVLDKVVRENPFLGNVQLYQWGEPFLNPQLAEIVRYVNSCGLKAAISSNLNAEADYEGVIKEKPEWLRISCSGCGDRYELTHAGGKWDVFYRNLTLIGKLKKQFHPQMKIEVFYHLYKHTAQSDLDTLQELCSRCDFSLHPVQAYLIGLDDVLAYQEGKTLPREAEQAAQLIRLPLDKGLQRAYSEIHLPCPAERCVLINPDLSVSNCMMYYYPQGNILADNYLQIPQQVILDKLGKSGLCSRCRAKAMHRYCQVYSTHTVDENRE